MLTYHLKPHDQQPLYEQLYHAVRADIMSGALPGGTRLPSKRQLAANLRVSQITVETAYGQLAAEGYIASAPRRGYFVQEQLAVPVSEPQEPFAPPLPPISASEETYPYDFRTDFVDNGCFPFSTWARLSRSVLSEYSSALLRATDPCGAAELREEIVRYLHDFRGINVSPDNILIGAGSEYLMHLVIQLLGRDRVYALENPGYRKLYQIFAVNGVTVRPTPLDKHGLRADALAASDASVVYLTPSHHFPLGTVMTAARRLEILRWASEAPDRYIIEDDYDSEFRYASRPIPALGELDRTGRVVYVNTFAKSLAPGLRIGYLVLPNALMARYRERFSRYSSTCRDLTSTRWRPSCTPAASSGTSAAAARSIRHAATRSWLRLTASWPTCRMRSRARKPACTCCCTCETACSSTNLLSAQRRSVCAFTRFRRIIRRRSSRREQHSCSAMPV